MQNQNKCFVLIFDHFQPIEYICIVRLSRECIVARRLEVSTRGFHRWIPCPTGVQWYSSKMLRGHCPTVRKWCDVAMHTRFSLLDS